MKIYFLLILFISCSFFSFAQPSLEGSWISFGRNDRNDSNEYTIMDFKQNNQFRLNMKFINSKGEDKEAVIETAIPGTYIQRGKLLFLKPDPGAVKVNVVYNNYEKNIKQKLARYPATKKDFEKFLDLSTEQIKISQTVFAITLFDGSQIVKMTSEEFILKYKSGAIERFVKNDPTVIANVKRKDHERMLASDTQIYTEVDEEPQFQGGTRAMSSFIDENLKYPKFAAENGIQGRVTLSVVVEKDGSLSNIRDMRSPSEDLTKEAIRVVQLMPRFKPGRKNGVPVRTQIQIPMTFRLN